MSGMSDSQRFLENQKEIDKIKHFTTFVTSHSK